MEKRICVMIDIDELEDMIKDLESLLYLQQFYSYDEEYEFHKKQVEKLLRKLQDKRGRCEEQ